MKEWYEIDNIEEIDSPSLVLYEDRLQHNLELMLKMVDGDSSKLMPHIKTNKMPEVIKRMIALGMKDFKASTIAEAEMAAGQGANSVLIAHQLVGLKVGRLGELIRTFPKTSFSTIIDNEYSLKLLELEAARCPGKISVFIDVNSGMNRSGIEIGSQLDELISNIISSELIDFRGLHVYDGHQRNPDFQLRKEKVESEFQKVTTLFKTLKAQDSEIKLICGGTPTFTAHLSEQSRISSPGTCVLWDWGYGSKLKEQDFKFAALLVSRVISKPTAGIITIDLGHKAVAAENPIDKRVKFLNLNNYELLSQSEEHGVLRVENDDSIKVGDVLYGIPYHICPTVNLYDSISVINDGIKTTEWEITARRRKISI